MSAKFGLESHFRYSLWLSWLKYDSEKGKLIVRMTPGIRAIILGLPGFLIKVQNSSSLNRRIAAHEHGIRTVYGIPKVYNYSGSFLDYI